MLHPKEIHAIRAYNAATNPAVLRTAKEIERQRQRARGAKNRLTRRGLKLGIHYFEWSNGTLSPFNPRQNHPEYFFLETPPTNSNRQGILFFFFFCLILPDCSTQNNSPRTPPEVVTSRTPTSYAHQSAPIIYSPASVPHCRTLPHNQLTRENCKNKRQWIIIA